EEASQYRRAVRLLQIERQRLLGSIQPHEIARQAFDGGVVAAREVAAVGTLDLDDAGAEIGELPRGERCRHCLLERDDRDVFERARDLSPSLALRVPGPSRARF